MRAPVLGWATWAAMVAVLAAAAVLSFAALRDLAELCGVDPLLAPLLPVAIDAGAAVSTRVWLSGRAVVAERFARAMTWALLAVTVAGNALHSGLIASDVTPTWWTAVLVGAIPPAVVGATVHLAVLVGRPPGAACATPADTDGSEVTGPPAGGDDEPIETRAADDGATGQVRTVRVVAPAVTDPGTRETLAALAADGAGRRRVARVLGTTEYRAGELLAAHRNGHGGVTG